MFTTLLRQWDQKVALNSKVRPADRYSYIPDVRVLLDIGWILALSTLMIANFELAF